MSEEHNNSNYFYIQSADRINGTATNFNVNNQNFGNSSSMELQVIVIPYTFYPVDSNHTTLTFQINGSGVNLNATIPAGYYDSTTFPVALKTAMDTAAGTQTYTITISGTTGLITITQNSGTFLIKGSSTMNPIIGFTSSDTSGAITQISPNLINLSGTDYLDIYSSQLTKFDTKSLDSALSNTTRVIRIPVKDYTFGSTITYRPKFHHMNHKPEDQGQIDVIVRDMYGNIISLNGRDWYMKFKYHSDRPHRKTIRAGNHMDYFSAATFASKN
jgi:hypothetical protein